MPISLPFAGKKHTSIKDTLSVVGLRNALLLGILSNPHPDAQEPEPEVGSQQVPTVASEAPVVTQTNSDMKKPESVPGSSEVVSEGSRGRSASVVVITSTSFAETMFGQKHVKIRRKDLLTMSSISPHTIQAAHNGLPQTEAALSSSSPSIMVNHRPSGPHIQRTHNFIKTKSKSFDHCYEDSPSRPRSCSQPPRSPGHRSGDQRPHCEGCQCRVMQSVQCHDQCGIRASEALKRIAEKRRHLTKAPRRQAPLSYFNQAPFEGYLSGRASSSGCASSARHEPVMTCRLKVAAAPAKYLEVPQDCYCYCPSLEPLMRGRSRSLGAHLRRRQSYFDMAGTRAIIIPEEARDPGDRDSTTSAEDTDHPVSRRRRRRPSVSSTAIVDSDHSCSASMVSTGEPMTRATSSSSSSVCSPLPSRPARSAVSEEAVMASTTDSSDDDVGPNAITSKSTACLVTNL